MKIKYETESNYKHNEILQNITIKMYKLRIIESQKKSLKYKFKIANPILKNIFNKLLKINNYVVYRRLWDELHDRQAFYYDYCNRQMFKKKSKKCPLFRHTLHNQVVPDWLKFFKKNKHTQLPILHFDTHDDMNIIENVNKSCLDLKEINKGACGLINHPITCMIWIGQVDNVIWCIPKWVYDNNISLEQALVIKNKSGIRSMMYIRDDTQPVDKYILPYTTKIVNKNKMNSEFYDFYKEFKFNRYHITNNWSKLNKIINKNSKYILDIDLDFFCCEGSKLDKSEYKKTFGDLSSTGRISIFPNFSNPRNELENPDAIKINKKILKEIKLIDNRIKIFLNGIKYLKSRGKTPCIINISDSTASLFSGMNERAVLTNSYCPKYLVPYINNKLINGLKKLKLI